MKLFLFSFFIVLLTPVAYPQTVVKVQVLDKSTKDPVHQAGISFQSRTSVSREYFTGRKGEVILTVPSGDSVTIQCNHLAYGTENRTIIPKGTLRDTLKVVLLLRFIKVTTYDEFVVYPKGVPHVVFQSERVSVDDFEFMPDGNMLLLTYAKTKKKGTELSLYNGMEILTRIPLEEHGNELIRDYRGNPHVVTDKNVYGITVENKQVRIGSLDKKYYMEYIAPIVDTTISKYFFTNFNPDYPAFDYYTYDIEDSSYRKIAKVEDELMMELYRSEYKWVDVRTQLWAKELENRTGIDKEVWVGASYFTQSIYYKELYAPLFKRNDTLFLFDHYKNLLFSYDKTGEIMDSVPIFYHLQPKQTGWKKELIQDQSTGQIYCLFEKTGKVTIRRVDVLTGELKETVPLHYMYPNKILIRGNHVYYTYRPFETAQKKYLYDEQLPFAYPESVLPSGDQVLSH